MEGATAYVKSASAGRQQAHASRRGIAVSLVLWLFRLFRLLRPLDRRQRLDVGGDRGAVGITQFAGVGDDLSHVAADGIAIRRVAGLEQFDQLLDRPTAQSVLGDI